jgi:hypothetical protein
MNRQEYDRWVDEFTDWTMTRICELAAADRRPPLVVPLTVTFQIGMVRPDRVLLEFERLYPRVCRLLVTNPERPSKRHLLPFVLAFRDDPSTRRDKHPVAASLLSTHPSVAEHVHSIMVVHPAVADRFLEVAGDLETVWRSIPRRGGGPLRHDNGSLRVELGFAHRVRGAMAADPAGCLPRVRGEVRRWIDYSAKLMRRRSAAADGDLYTALPTETNSPLAGRPSPGGIVRGLDYRPASDTSTQTLKTVGKSKPAGSCRSGGLFVWLGPACEP